MNTARFGVVAEQPCAVSHGDKVQVLGLLTSIGMGTRGCRREQEEVGLGPQGCMIPHSQQTRPA